MIKLLNRLLLCFCILGFSSTGHSAEPADKIIKDALADIQRFEQQASGLTPARASNARRILKLVNLSFDRLKTSSNQSDPSYQEVNQRYESLKGQLEGLINPTAASSNTTATPSPVATKNAEVTRNPTTDVPELVSGQRVRVKKLVKDIGNVQSSLVTTGPSTLQDPNEVAARKKRLTQFEEALARYPQVNDPDVQAARQAYESYRQLLSAEFKRAQEQLAQLGDVQQRLKTLAENAQTYAVPAALSIPFNETEAKAWVDASSKARTVAEHNLKQLAQIAPLAYLPNQVGTPQTGSPYDADDLNRMIQNSRMMLTEIQSRYEGMAAQLNNQMDHITNSVLSRWQEDPDSDKRYLFLQKDRQDEAFKLYDESMQMAQSSVFLETALGREAKTAEDMIAKVKAAKKEFLRKRDIALNTSRMPKAASKDKKMLKIAKEIVENPKYEFGQHDKIVLTTEAIVERERKDSEIDIDDVDVSLSGDVTMSGTETTWTYKWKEFKFAVPLKDDETDTWHIWWITAKNFSSGGPNTPLNKWISGSTTKGNQILKKNF